VKHAPQRTCVACREVRDKKDLIRLVILPDGSIEADISGKMMGRGAYLCRNMECWEEGLTKGRLGYALKTGVDRENSRRLLTWVGEYLKKADNPGGNTREE
jgi:predicted RNA-binding protein YlxR (DUF448 family)